MTPHCKLSSIMGLQYALCQNVWHNSPLKIFLARLDTSYTIEGKWHISHLSNIDYCTIASTEELKWNFVLPTLAWSTERLLQIGICYTLLQSYNLVFVSRLEKRNIGAFIDFNNKAWNFCRLDSCSYYQCRNVDMIRCGKCLTCVRSSKCTNRLKIVM